MARASSGLSDAVLARRAPGEPAAAAAAAARAAASAARLCSALLRVSSAARMLMATRRFRRPGGVGRAPPSGVVTSSPSNGLNGAPTSSSSPLGDVALGVAMHPPGGLMYPGVEAPPPGVTA